MATLPGTSDRRRLPRHKVLQSFINFSKASSSGATFASAQGTAIIHFLVRRHPAAQHPFLEKFKFQTHILVKLTSLSNFKLTFQNTKGVIHRRNILFEKAMNPLMAFLFSLPGLRYFNRGSVLLSVNSDVVEIRDPLVNLIWRVAQIWVLLLQSY